MTALNETLKKKLTKQSVEDLIAELDKYREAYYDSLTWGGPTIYPANPMTPERCFEVTKLLKEILKDHLTD